MGNTIDAKITKSDGKIVTKITNSGVNYDVSKKFASYVKVTKGY